jgi:hypothetical protein
MSLYEKKNFKFFQIVGIWRKIHFKQVVTLEYKRYRRLALVRGELLDSSTASDESEPED